MTALADPLPLARALIKKPSVTPDDAGALAVLEKALVSLGFACTRLPFGEDAGRPRIENLYARLGSAAPHLCFAGHTDVVPAGQGWTVPPFEAEVIDGHLYGRGATDMKGAIAAFVAAVARLRAAGHSGGSISLLITGDEEARALDGTRRVLEWLKAKGERLDCCIVGEPTSVRRLGDTIKIGRRGSLNGTLTVHGVQGHSAYPERADNPIPRLIEMLRAITAEPLDGGSAHFQASTVALTTVDVGNRATNVIPAAARAGFNIRFNDLHDSAAIVEWLRARFDSIGGEYELEIEVSGESFLTPPGRLSETLAGAIKKVTGLTPDINTGGGTSDARFISHYCPVLEFGLVGQTMHQVDERVAVADLETLTRVYEAFLTRWFETAAR